MTEMPSNLLHSLIKDFEVQKGVINKQIEDIDPLATALRMPVASRLFNSGLLIFIEILVWIAIAAMIAFTFYMDKLYPFTIWNQVTYDSDLLSTYQRDDFIYLGWIIRAAAIFVALLLFWIARLLSTIRMKNSILNIAGNSMKDLVAQHLKRKAAIEQMENKYPEILITDTDSVVLPKENPPSEEQNHPDILL